jgi:DNA-binding NarL/FixJ family response regulator
MGGRITPTTLSATRRANKLNRERQRDKDIRQVKKLHDEGRSNAEIAEALIMSENAVRNILSK